MDRYCLVSHIDQLLVKTRDMAFGALETSGAHKNWDDLTDCVVPEYSIVLSYVCWILQGVFVQSELL